MKILASFIDSVPFFFFWSHQRCLAALFFYTIKVNSDQRLGNSQKCTLKGIIGLSPQT